MELNGMIRWLCIICATVDQKEKVYAFNYMEIKTRSTAKTKQKSTHESTYTNSEKTIKINLYTYCYVEKKTRSNCQEKYT